MDIPCPQCDCAFCDGLGSERLAAMVDAYGHGVIGLSDYAYSVGLWEAGFPELIVSGMSARQATVTINQVTAMMRTERAYPEHNEILPDLFTAPTKFLWLPETEIQKRMGHALERMGERRNLEMPAIQIVWPDKKGRWPDDPQFGYAGREILFV